MSYTISDEQLVKIIRSECAALAWPFFESGDFDLNLFGVRGPSRIADRFDDVLGCACKITGVWRVYLWKGTTDPGKPCLAAPIRPEGCAIMAPGYYPGLWQIGDHHAGRSDAYRALVQRGEARVYRDDNRDQILDLSGPTTTDVSGLNQHKAGKNSSVVGGWSAACQVHASHSTFEELMALADKQVSQRGWKSFSYKLFDVSQSPRLQVLLHLAGVL